MIEKKMFRFATDSFAEHDAIVRYLARMGRYTTIYEYES